MKLNGERKKRRRSKKKYGVLWCSILMLSNVQSSIIGLWETVDVRCACVCVCVGGSFSIFSTLHLIISGIFNWNICALIFNLLSSMLVAFIIEEWERNTSLSNQYTIYSVDEHQQQMFFWFNFTASVFLLRWRPAHRKLCRNVTSFIYDFMHGAKI